MTISVKLINHEHRRDKTLLKPIDRTISPRTGLDVLEELENILTSEVENLRKYSKKMDAILTFLSRPKVKVKTETTCMNTENIWREINEFKHYWKYLSKKMKLKLRLDISFILKDKTKEDVKVKAKRRTRKE